MVMVFPAKETEAEVGDAVGFEVGLTVGDGTGVGFDVGVAVVGAGLVPGAQANTSIRTRHSKPDMHIPFFTLVPPRKRFAFLKLRTVHRQFGSHPPDSLDYSPD